MTHFVSGECPGTTGSGKPAVQTREDRVAGLLKFSSGYRHIGGLGFPCEKKYREVETDEINIRRGNLIGQRLMLDP